MRLELFVALPPVMSFHVIKGVANDRPRRCVLPGTRRASPAVKMGLFNPYQLADHDGWILHSHGCAGRTFDRK
jgi:hypothetical protein